MIFIAQTPVEVISMFVIAPEGFVRDVERLTHHPRNRAVEFAHHFAKPASLFEISDDVIVVGHQGDDPWLKKVLARVLLELGPEEIARFRIDEERAFFRARAK